MAASLGKKTPSDFLKQVLGNYFLHCTIFLSLSNGFTYITVIGYPVIVKLNSGVSYRGVLACLDGTPLVCLSFVCFDDMLIFYMMYDHRLYERSIRTNRRMG
jgi:hypothetical protein